MLFLIPGKALWWYMALSSTTIMRVLRAMSPQLAEEDLECHGIEMHAHGVNERAVAQADRVKAGH